jgi:AraC-like DNA-binding protein
LITNEETLPVMDQQTSTGTPSVLEQYDAEKCQSSESNWLPPRGPANSGIARSRRPENVITWPDNEVAEPQVIAEPPLTTLAKQYIRDYCSEDLSLDQVAGALGADSFLLGQLFKQTTEMNFHDYVTSVRVEKAKNLLLNPNYYFIEIASELGFESLGQFSQAFIKIIGEPLHTYRARLPDCSASTLQGVLVPP